VVELLPLLVAHCHASNTHCAHVVTRDRLVIAPCADMNEPWTLRSMASQTTGDDQACYEVKSFIRGFHVYQDVWTPVIGELLLLKREPENVHDKHAVAVIRQCDNARLSALQPQHRYAVLHRHWQILL